METTGILLFAKTPGAAEGLMKQFRSRKVSNYLFLNEFGLIKCYICIYRRKSYMLLKWKGI